jgi:hypothetical protein
LEKNFSDLNGKYIKDLDYRHNIFLQLMPIVQEFSWPSMSPSEIFGKKESLDKILVFLYGPTPKVQKKRRNRFNMIKQGLNQIIARQNYPIYVLTTLLSGYEQEKFAKEAVSLAKMSTDLNWKPQWVEQVDLLEYVTQRRISKEYEIAFEGGDEKAIFEYCKQDREAIRRRWVLDQIEKWKKQDTDSSRKKIKKLIASIVQTAEKTSFKKILTLSHRDMDIVNEIILRASKDVKKSIEEHINDIAKSRDLGSETVREIFQEYRAIRAIIRELSWWLRGKVAGFPIKAIEPIEIKTMLVDLFKFDTFMKSLEQQLRIYQNIRFSISDAKYEGQNTLLRTRGGKVAATEQYYYDVLKNTTEKESSKLCIAKNVSGNIIDPFGFVRIDPLEYTKEVYNDFRNWEAIRNLDNLDDMQIEIGIEEV